MIFSKFYVNVKSVGHCNSGREICFGEYLPSVLVGNPALLSVPFAKIIVCAVNDESVCDYKPVGCDVLAKSGGDI